MTSVIDWTENDLPNCLFIIITSGRGGKFWETIDWEASFATTSKKIQQKTGGIKENNFVYIHEDRVIK